MTHHIAIDCTGPLCEIARKKALDIFWSAKRHGPSDVYLLGGDELLGSHGDECIQIMQEATQTGTSVHWVRDRTEVPSMAEWLQSPIP